MLAGEIHTTRTDDPILRGTTCEQITKELPDWFAQEHANVQYIKDAQVYPGVIVKNRAQEVIGLLIYKAHQDDILRKNVINIHWLGVLPRFHRQGAGIALINELTAIAREQSIDCLTVETLDPKVEDESYLKTFSFYKKLGFEIFHYFQFDIENPAVRMKKELSKQ